MRWAISCEMWSCNWRNFWNSWWILHFSRQMPEILWLPDVSLDSAIQREIDGAWSLKHARSQWRLSTQEHPRSLTGRTQLSLYRWKHWIGRIVCQKAHVRSLCWSFIYSLPWRQVRSSNWYNFRNSAHDVLGYACNIWCCSFGNNNFDVAGLSRLQGIRGTEASKKKCFEAGKNQR